MRKYGRWMLALGIMAASPAVSFAQSQYVGQRAYAGRYANQQPAQSYSAPPVQQQAAPPTQTNYNQQMAEQIAGALRNAQLRGYDVEIEFKDGVATLMGKVKDGTNKQRATQAVQALPGVNRVANQLQVLEQAKPIVQQTAAVAPQTQPVRQAAYAGSGSQQVQQVQYGQPQGPNNQRVAEGIANALSSAGLQGYDVDIQFQNGIATLLGNVGTPQQRAMAEQLTSRVPGVRSVANQLRLQQQVQPTAYQTSMPMAAAPVLSGSPPPMTPGAPMAGGPTPMPGMGGGGAIYGSANLPDYAWPSYAQYPNSAAISYPTQYSASAWPYIGPYYPYPQVPLGWRQAQLEWDDGHWQLSFNKKTDRWWWFLKPSFWTGDN